MKTRLVGDIHGQFNDYSTFALKDCPNSIQLGDFGIGFSGDFWHNKVATFQTANPGHRFIRGNHDNPEKCKTMPGFITDGKVENDVMFIGGAWSIDRAWRTEGIDWWPDEELSIVALDHLIGVYDMVRPRVMITHDAPTDVTFQMFVQSGLALGGSSAKKINTRTGQALQAMFDIHQPDEWYFGHWHVTMQCKFGRTMFHCLGELDFVDIEL